MRGCAGRARSHTWRGGDTTLDTEGRGEEEGGHSVPQSTLAVTHTALVTVRKYLARRQTAAAAEVRCRKGADLPPVSGFGQFFFSYGL